MRRFTLVSVLVRVRFTFALKRCPEASADGTLEPPPRIAVRGGCGIRIGNSFPLRVLLVTATLVSLSLVAVVAVIAAPVGKRYAVSAGDAPEGAPDVTSVWVSRPTPSRVGFRVAFANRTTMRRGDLVDVFLDSDRNTATAAGPPGWDGLVYGYAGVDYEIFVTDEQPDEATVWGPTLNDTACAPVTWKKRAMSFTIDKRLIGNPRHAFDFAITSTGRYSSDSPTEHVPHSGMYTYVLGR
jgi:hypothetical protein